MHLKILVSFPDSEHEAKVFVQVVSLVSRVKALGLEVCFEVLSVSMCAVLVKEIVTFLADLVLG